jgi:hypothetical protein
VADVTTPPPPTVEIGKAGNGNGNWWTPTDGEQTPELRWPLSVFVYDRMRNTDAQIAAVLRAVTLPVRRTTWRIEPAGARPEVAAQIATDLGLPLVGGETAGPQRTKDRFAWADHLRLALLMLPFGHMFFEQVVRIDEAGMVRLRKLAPRMPRTIAAIKVAADGGLESIEQLTIDGSVTIPVTRLVAYVHDREGPNWHGRSLLRPAYKNWLLKDRLLRVQTQTIDRNGMGVPVYTGADGESDLSGGQTLATTFRSGENSGAAIPFGATLKFQGVDGRIPDAEAAIRYHDEQIARAALAHFLNLGTQTGSWALGSTFADFFTLSLQALAEQVADVAQQHVIEDLVDWNWGPDEPSPQLVFDEIGSRHEATAQALKALSDAGLIFPDKVTEEAIRQMFGLPSRNATTPAPA